MKGGRKRSRHASTSEDPADRHERLHASTRRGDHIAATQAVEASAPSPSPSATPVEAPLATPAPSATPVGAPSATPAPSATRAPAELDPAPLSPMAELPRSRFYTPGRGERDEVAALCAQLLGGSVAAYLAEFEAAGGQNIRFITLKTMYTSAMDGGRYEDAARIWLVNQLGATLFASKSGGYHTTVYWIGMLEDLGRVSEYAWGAIALASLYEQLSRASRRKTTQIGGFTSLVLSWAYEYISSSVIIRTEVPGYTQDQPRAQRWSTSRIAHSGLDERRVMLDELTVDDITWTPFEDHRDVRPRDPRALYSGNIRTPYGRSVSRHLPERVMRQFGFIQDIPRHPSEIQTTGSLAETTDAAYAEFEPHLRPQGIPATYPGEAVEGYMRWYSRVSHVFIIPEDRREELSAVSAIRRGVELLEQSLEVPGALAPGTQPRILTERALDLFRRSSFIGTQGVAFSAIRGAAAAGGRARGEEWLGLVVESNVRVGGGG
ncbi:protein MAINTENANCE OF MERISTEMS-like [Lotus japonicus]|uniref:protein MAINTENANCE OF MERISTEMS-like n=1 Tax=Lotus japonicus TaxID=34305 RepID=UPI00258B9987|nr:protein MAINTENANCE OF MERISTEMS-like [Lotus japonicus]